MTALRVVAVAHVLALWPSVRWYVLRITDGAGEAWGLAAAALAVWAWWAGRSSEDGARKAPDLRIPAATLAAYAAAAALLPPLFAGAIGVLSLCTLAAAASGRRWPSLPLAGLSLLALPDVSTLQYYVGWPFRVGVGAAAAPLLRMLGIEVERHGTTLSTATRAVVVDAPCSGVWMLWGGLVLTFALAARARSGAVRTTLAALALVPVVFLGNLMRTLGAFLVETSPRSPPAWVHEGVGVLAFCGVVAVILTVARRLSRSSPCAA